MKWNMKWWYWLMPKVVRTGVDLFRYNGSCSTISTTSMLEREVKRFVVSIVWSLDIIKCFLSLLWLWRWLPVGTSVHSVGIADVLDAFRRTGLSSHTLFNDEYIDSSFYRTSMIFQAYPSSSNTLHECDSYSLHFLQFDSRIESAPTDKIWE